MLSGKHQHERNAHADQVANEENAVQKSCYESPLHHWCSVFVDLEPADGVEFVGGFVAVSGASLAALVDHQSLSAQCQPQPRLLPEL